MVDTNENFGGMFDLLEEVDRNLPIWTSELIIPKELWFKPVEGLVDVFKQKKTDRPKNLVLYGNTDCGKTTFLRHIISSMKKKYNLGQFGIVYVSCLTNTTLKGLYHSILRELHWSFSRTSSIQELEPLVGLAAKNRNCQLIVIDEFSQLRSNSDISRQKDVLKALRNIPKQTYRPIIIVGVREVIALLKMDPETNNRFMKIEFPRFRLVKNEWRVFQRVVKSLDVQVGETVGITSKFAQDPEVLQLLFENSRGKMGSLVSIYERSVKHAIKGNSNTLDIEHLNQSIAFFNENQLLHDNEENECEIGDKWWVD